MLAELRKHSKSVIIYVLFGIIIVVFVFTFNMSSRRRDSSVGYGRQYENAELVVVGIPGLTWSISRWGCD